MRSEQSASRYRGVDRRTPVPATETLNAPRVTAVVLGVGVAAVALTRVVGPTATRSLGNIEVVAGSLAMLAGAAMFIRWRIEGRAQSWWLACGYVVAGLPALLDSPGLAPNGSLYAAAFGVALAFFVVAWRTPEVDSILSVRRAAVVCAGGLGAAALLHLPLERWPGTTRPATALLAVAYAVLALLWRGSSQDKPWFVVPLAGIALVCIALVAEPLAGARSAEIAVLQVVVSAIVAATALAGLQAAASRHRALALDAARERDLVNTIRHELEKKYADTLHEVRSIVLALEGGIQVFRPLESAGTGISETLTQSIVAELERLRSLADPDHAPVRADFMLIDALRHLLALSRASGWPVTWNVPDDLEVRGRPADVAQIVHSLLSNANKYAPGPVEVSAVSAGGFVLVLVDDHGPGVKPANRERIFERGARPEHGETHEGHGLGLHIARRLARSLGGELWVEQQPHGGSRFVLALRRASDALTDSPSEHRNAS